jgi:hypothetical protein
MPRTARTISVSALALCAATALAVPQTRAKKEEPKDLPALLTQVQKSWTAADYPACMRDLKTCVSLASQRWIQAIRESLPAAPEGWTRVEPPKEDPQANAMVAALTVGVGTVVEQRYTRERQRIDVTVNADSPVIGMMSMMFQNPALLGPNKELVEYGTHKAILDTTNKQQLDLQILISNKHLVQVRCPESDEFLFAMFDQAAIDKLAAALGS